MSLAGEPASRGMRAPCPSTWQARSGLKVPFARCRDGITRHVDRIIDRSLAPFICLGCDEELIRREPRRARNHFAHRSDTRCSGETVLHRYAKELLASAREFTFTPLILHQAGMQERVYEGGRFVLDAVSIEEDRTNFRPDAIVRIGERSFAIEFKVSNAVSEEKRLRVAETDLPMIEVDLNALRSGQVDADDLDESILHGATREWVHHPDLAEGRLRLQAQVDARSAERGRRLRYHIEKENWVQPPQDWYDDTMAAVADAGLGDLLDRRVDCAHWFRVAPRIWQAEILAVCVVAPSIQYSPGSRLEIKGQWPQEQSLASRLPDWMVRTDLSYYRNKALEAAGYSTSSYGTPDTAIRDYLFDLSTAGGIVFWDRDEQAFFIEGELHGYLHRRHELRWKLRQILEAANAPQAEAVTERWMRKYNVSGQSPESVARQGGESYETLLQRIDNLRRMANARYESYVVDDLCGLSLQALRETRLREQEQREAKRLKELADVADARRVSLERDARQDLSDEAAEWLRSPSPDASKTILEWAGENDAQLQIAERQLGQAMRRRKARQAAAEAVEDYQRQLDIKVRAVISDPQRADLFLKAWRATCDSPAALSAILAKLPKRR
ncbi:hypothetical protein [Novosphingobium sp. JCM 18896]|uniref:competence protein CoiA family protein n=1 Tax=Novosphingobium sp. JCM 18896 TaxID=2989731 RepID=UPI002221C2DD|nr:hypothetical protein [Novosphingobium sp. JCM 18896]MCW1432158.1 hypothetical protein [Novosphingobium sp. JCM 18896]